MQRPAALEHHVVGHVDDVADRPHPREREPALHPLRRLAHRDLRGHAPTKRGQRSGASTTTRAPATVVDDRAPARVRSSVNGRPKCAASSRATPTMPIASGRFGVIDRSNTTSSRPSTSRTSVPSARVGRQREDAGVVVAEAELARRAQHALGHDAADLAPLDREVAGQHRADPGERHDHARLDVRRAAHDAQLTVAEVDVGEADAVGVGVRQRRRGSRATTTR